MSFLLAFLKTNLFRRQSSVCVYVSVCVNYVNYLFVYYVTFVFTITVL